MLADDERAWACGKSISFIEKKTDSYNSNSLLIQAHKIYVNIKCYWHVVPQLLTRKLMLFVNDVENSSKQRKTSTKSINLNSLKFFRENKYKNKYIFWLGQDT